MNCHNCGSQINEGNLFCVKCGARQTTNTETSQSMGATPDNNPRVAPPTPTNSFTQQINFSMLKNIFVKMFLKPVSGAKEFIAKTETNSVIVVVVLLAAAQGLLGVWKVNQIVSSLETTIVNFVKQMVGLANLFNSSSSSPSASDIAQLTAQIAQMKALLSIPYGQIFFQNAVILVVGVAVTFIIITVGIAVLNQRKSSSLTILKTSLIVSVPVIYFETLGILLAYLSSYLGLFVFCIGVIVSISALSIILKEQLYIDANYSTFIAAVAFVVSCGVILVCMKSFITSDMGSIISSAGDFLKKIF